MDRNSILLEELELRDPHEPAHSRREFLQASQSETPGTADHIMSASVPLTSRTYQGILLFSGFMMCFHVIGMNSIYGIFQDFYTSPGSNIKQAIGQDALVSLVGTIGTGLTWSGSIFVNPLLLRIRQIKYISLAGAFVMSTGLFLASFSTKLWQLYLTQAMLYGIGSSMYYFPVMTIAPIYFNKNRGFAMGFILAGSGVGGLVLAPILRLLLDKVGIGWALRILSIWNAFVGIPVTLVLRPPPEAWAAGRRQGVDLSLTRRGTFWYQAIGAFLQSAGNIVPVIYIASYATTVLGYPNSTASLFIAVNNAVNSISRIIMGIVADRVGRQNTMLISVLLSGLSVLAFWFGASQTRFIVFVVFYGIYAGGYNALLPTTITEVYGVQHYASVNAFIYFVRGIGAIFGAPIAGVILGSHRRSGYYVGEVSAIRIAKAKYNDVVIFDAILLVMAAGCMGAVRWLDAKNKHLWRWKA